MFDCKVHGQQFGDHCEVCDLERVRIERMMFARCEAMGLAPAYHCLRFNGYWTDLDGQREALSCAREFLAGDFRTLIFTGGAGSPGYGTGKTTLAATILYEAYRQRNIVGLYSLASRLFTELKDAIDCKAGSTQQIKDRFTRSPLLVIDEIATEPMTGYDKKTLSDIMAERIEFGRQTVIITNRSKQDLAANLHPRVLDRLRGSSSSMVFDWPSARGAR